MPRSAIAGLVAVRIVFTTTGGKTWELVYHARTVDGSANTTAKMMGLATACDLGTTWKPLVHTNVTYNGVTVDDLSPSRLPSQTATGGAGAGTLAGNFLPDENCLVVTNTTDQVGRAFRGRKYFSGLVQASLQDATHWTAAASSARVGADSTVRVAMGSASPTGYSPVIYHRRAGAGGVPAADSTTTITGNVGRTLLAAQRGRVRRRSKH